MRRHPADESGQVLVEAALLLPLWIFVLLALLQLVLIQEARLLLEYAGYRAVRTGAIRSAEPERMAAAARFVLGPTVCPSRWPGVRCPGGGSPAERARAGAEALRHLEGGGFPGLVLAVEAPGASLGDFDRTDGSEAVRRAGLLAADLRYWLELKIPFADAGLWHAWSAFGMRRAELPQRERLAAAQAAAGGRYFVPLATRHTFRMQSNRWDDEEAP